MTFFITENNNYYGSKNFSVSSMRGSCNDNNCFLNNYKMREQGFRAIEQVMHEKITSKKLAVKIIITLLNKMTK